MVTCNQIIKFYVDEGFLLVDVEGGVLYSTLRGIYVLAKPRLRRVSPDSQGYPAVYLRHRILNGDLHGTSKCRVHRVIAYAKYGDSVFEPGMVVHHINYNREDNRGENLELVAKSVNSTLRRPSRLSVRDPATGAIIARFSSKELAREYALWKFGAGEWG